MQDILQAGSWISPEKRKLYGQRESAILHRAQGCLITSDFDLSSRATIGKGWRVVMRKVSSWQGGCGALHSNWEPWKVEKEVPSLGSLGGASLPVQKEA